MVTSGSFVAEGRPVNNFLGNTALAEVFILALRAASIGL